MSYNILSRLAKFEELIPSTIPFVEGKLKGHQERKNYSESLKLYEKALKKYPESFYGQWAGWRLGWINYIDGKLNTEYEKE